MSIILTILGIGLLLLIHEGGHYFAARAVGIRVKVFALGFGPRLFGWHRNGTDFRVSLLPLGGYVQVAGDDPSRPPRPGDLFYANAPQRLLFYAGGILANLAFAFIIIPVLFSVGVPFVSPTVGSVQDSSPAWQAGVLPDDIVQNIDGREVHGFRHISSGIALASRDSRLDVTVLRDGAPLTLVLNPEFNTAKGFSTIGIGPAFVLQLSAASEISAKLKGFGHLVAINGHSLSTAMGTQLALFSLTDGAETFSLTASDSTQTEQTFEFTATDYYNTSASTVPQLGVTVLAQQIATVRGSLADFLKEGDQIIEANGKHISQQSKLLAVVALNESQPLSLKVRDSEQVVRSIVIPAITALQLQHDLALTLNDKLAFEVHPLSAAYAAGLRSGCSILRADQSAIQKMSDLREVIGKSVAGEEIVFSVLQPQATTAVNIAVIPAPIPQLDFGLMLSSKPTTVIARNPLHAIKLGYQEAKAMVVEVTTTAKRLFTGEVASKNMGGIISIGVMTNSFASQGLVSLLFFLCLISVNLAILNLLPIPALDGGHILFALYEIITRRKVSVRVQNVFQLVGVILVLSMLVFVTTNDIQRLWD
jgi:regulator of sigma E protease